MTVQVALHHVHENAWSPTSDTENFQSAGNTIVDTAGSNVVDINTSRKAQTPACTKGLRVRKNTNVHCENIRLFVRYQRIDAAAEPVKLHQSPTL